MGLISTSQNWKIKQHGLYELHESMTNLTKASTFEKSKCGKGNLWSTCLEGHQKLTMALRKYPLVFPEVCLFSRILRVNHARKSLVYISKEQKFFCIFQFHVSMLSRNIESIRSTHILFDNISTIGIDLKINGLINQLISLGINKSTFE